MLAETANPPTDLLSLNYSGYLLYTTVHIHEINS